MQYAARLPPVRLPEQLDRAGKRVFRGLSGGWGPGQCPFALAAPVQCWSCGLPAHRPTFAATLLRRSPLADLVEDCTRLDPFARPSFRDILLRLKSLGTFSAGGREMA